MTYTNLIISNKRLASIQRKHPWIFSGAILNINDRQIKNLDAGEVVQLVDQNNNYLAIAHYAKGTIAARILTFQNETIDEKFWINKIRKAYNLRIKLGLANSNKTNCYRLIHGEGDGLPGLIIDIYDNTAVIQAHSIGMAKSLKQISKAIQSLEICDTVYSKSKATLHQGSEGDFFEDGYLYNESTVPKIVKEGELKFEVDWENGQKTGFFIDQRVNRELLKQYSSNKSVLNTFCYSGGFSIYALSGGASYVHSIDSSQRAIDSCIKNLTINGFDANRNKCFVSDTFKYLQNSNEKYDIIVLDPPAYAKNIKAKHRATQAYKRLNIEALKHLNKDGLLFTFSCSQAIHRQLFEDTIRAAAIESGRSIQILHHLSQGPDHPVNAFHPEGAYLKGLVLVVD